MKNTKFFRTMLTVALVLTIIGSVTGGTIAWFTDDVTSTGNVIQTGTLDIKLYAADLKEYAGKTTPWEEVTNDSAPLFDYDKWEPGYTAAKYLKIENAGNLAFNWELIVKPAMNLEFADENSKLLQDTITLSKAIDVYVAPFGEYATFAELKTAAGTNVFNLYDLAEASTSTNKGTVTGKMEAGAADIPMVVALHMKEEAGNECQDLKISDGFVIQLRASQATVESDAFGTGYDKGAYNDMPAAFVKQMDEDQLAETNAAIQEYNDDLALDVAYLFATTDLPANAADNSHAYWHADFVVSFDKPVAANTLGLAGMYEAWNGGTWVNIPLDTTVIGNIAELNQFADSTTVPADTEIRLLKDGAYMAFGITGKEIYVNYQELCAGVVQFMCGAYANGNGPAEETTMTVKLNLYEAGEDPTGATDTVNYETGKVLTIGTFTHTFPAAE